MVSNNHDLFLSHKHRVNNLFMSADIETGKHSRFEELDIVE